MSRLGVVTVTYNSGSVLAPFLACCARQQGVDFVLVVVDNASKDQTRALLERTDRTRMQVLLNEANLGVAEGNNQGIEIALAHGCDRILLLNNDTEFGPTLFADLTRSLEANGCDALTPRIVFHDDPASNWFVAGEFKYVWGPDARHETMATPRSVAYAISYAPTCCMIVRDSVFAHIGLMDAAYFVYWDDTDFCLRMQRAGLRLMCDTSLSMSHKVSSLTGGTTSDFFIRYHHRNQVYYVRKHFGLVVLAYTLLMSILKAAIRVPLRGDTLRQFGLRLRSMVEGFSLPVAGQIDLHGRPRAD